MSRRRPRSSRGTRWSKRAWQGRTMRRTEEKRMRMVLKVMLLSAGIGLASTSGISAAPVNGVVIKDATASSAQAMPFSSHGSQLTAPDATLVADECPTGYTLHPRLHLCVAEPTCPSGSTLHPRLHLCVTTPTCPSGSTWHPKLHRCVTP